MVDQPVDDIELVKERTPDSPILVLRIPEWDLGDRMLKCLRVANMSAKQMAAYLEVSETTITNWVRGRTQPSAASLRAWADITHVSTATASGGRGGSHRAVRGDW